MGLFKCGSAQATAGHPSASRAKSHAAKGLERWQCPWVQKPGQSTVYTYQDGGMWVYQLPGTALTRYHGLCALNNRSVLSRGFGGQKPEVKVLAGLSSFPGH